jgi:tRNA(Ile)-lysidine synthase
MNIYPFETTFQQFVEENNLFDHTKRLLVAVSGGVDSISMAHILYKWKYQIAIVHCNFQLRGAESDEEENFVKNWAEQKQIQLFIQHFNTKQFAQEHKITIQEAARKLRYDYFNELAIEHQFDFIVIAHNLDDVMETFFINLLRGTGIKGLTSIPLTNGKLVRPFLFAPRKDILAYAQHEQLLWKDDSSNASDKYLRNQIRHHIIPALSDIEPAVYSTFKNTIEHIKDTNALFEYWLNEKSAAYIHPSKIGLHIKLHDLLAQPYGKTWLFHLLQPYQFNKDHVEQICQTHQSGKQFISAEYKAYIDRDELIVAKYSGDEKDVFIIHSTDSGISVPVPLQILLTERTSDFIISTDTNIGSFDADKIKFPLILRKWHDGDMFQPFGMNNFKKLSDFFIDLKISVPEKENIWILENANNEIIWVVGYRIDNRYRISEETKKILVIHVTQNQASA